MAIPPHCSGFTVLFQPRFHNAGQRAPPAGNAQRVAPIAALQAQVNLGAAEVRSNVHAHRRASQRVRFCPQMCCKVENIPAAEGVWRDRLLMKTRPFLPEPFDEGVA